MITRRAYPNAPYVWSSIVRTNGTKRTITGATVELAVYPYGMGELHTQSLTAGASGAITGTITASTLADNVGPGLHRYEVRMTLSGLTEIVEEGLLDVQPG